VLTVRYVSGAAAARTVAYGRSAEAVGRLVDEHGRPIRNAIVDVASTSLESGAQAVALAPAVTGADGSFRYTISGRGPNRGVEFGYRFQREGSVVSSARLGVTVRAGVRLSVALAGSSVRYRGQVLAGTMPRTGKLVLVQGRSAGGRWQTFASRRARGKGTFSGRYRLKVATPAAGCSSASAPSARPAGPTPRASARSSPAGSGESPLAPPGPRRRRRPPRAGSGGGVRRPAPHAPRAGRSAGRGPPRRDPDRLAPPDPRRGAPHRPATPNPVTICIVDTGVTPTPDLDITARYAYDGGTLDDVTAKPGQPGHGTTVAHFAAAAVNGWGGAGVFPHAKIASVRVFPEEGGAAWQDYITAFDRCREIDDQTRVVVMALGARRSRPVRPRNCRTRSVVLSGGST
jgi:hypothetical protein